MPYMPGGTGSEKIEKYQKLGYTVVSTDEAHIRCREGCHILGGDAYEDTDSLERGSPRVFAVLQHD